MTEHLTSHDLDRLSRLGIAPESANNQLRLLHEGVPPLVPVRTCTISDGIRQASAQQVTDWLEICRTAVCEGKVTLFIPASGNASRMFSMLENVRRRIITLTRDNLTSAVQAGDKTASDVQNFLFNISKLPFYNRLSDCCTKNGTELTSLLNFGEYNRILDLLLDENGLGYSSLPKALIDFQAYPQETRSFAVENAAAASEWGVDRNCATRIHFSVPEGYQSRFELQIHEYEKQHPERSFSCGYSTQSPATDTLSLDQYGNLLRDANNELVLRPGGHGALLQNLRLIESEVIYIKTIENIVPDHKGVDRNRHRKIVTGCLIELKSQIDRWLARMSSGVGITSEEAKGISDWIVDWFGVTCPIEVQSDLRNWTQWLIDRLDRPMSVAGMVPNTGEPGGGPYWVKMPDQTILPQIVEQNQLGDDNDELIKCSTHFNATEIACSIRNRHGELYDLSHFLEPSMAMIVEKQFREKTIRCLELPGLWNGSMAYWNRVFLEIDIPEFLPIKTVMDWLR